MGSQKKFSGTFPDMLEAFEIQSVDGNVVLGINRTAGTHTGDFDLSGIGIGVIPATEKSATTVFFVTLVIDNGKIVSAKASRWTI